MVPNEADIRKAAYFRWERLGRAAGTSEIDWLETELDLLLNLNYHILFACKIDFGEKIFLRDGDERRCRYCGESGSNTTFKKEAHALPELIGNRVLISLDECDRCNKFFGDTLEDHFSKFTLPFRSSLALPGKKGVPSYKTRDKLSRIDYDASGRRFSIVEKGQQRILAADESAKRLTLSLEAPPYIPMAVAKCLTKMGLAILPLSEFRHFRRALEWIRNPSHSADEDAAGSLGCYLCFSSRPFPEAWVSVLRRNEHGATVPHLLFLVGFAHVLIQTYLPFCDRDRHLQGARVIVPRYDLASMPGFEGSYSHAFPLGSTEPERSTKLSLTLTYESEEKIDESEWPFPAP